jgi:transcriptional regulator with GAF, ATPase, and Fis domain
LTARGRRAEQDGTQRVGAITMLPSGADMGPGLRDSLYELAKLLLEHSDPDRTAELLLERVREATGAERGFVVVREDDRFVQKLDVDYDRSKLGLDERRFSRTIVKLAIDSRELVATEAPSEDVRFVSAESVESLGKRSVRAVPFINGDRVVGVLYLERRTGGFSEESGDFLREIASIAAALLARALDGEALRRRNRELERDLFAQHDFRDIVTRDPGMMALLRMVAQVADSDASILVRGETGTGKELIARALHVNSGRRRKPFVIVHCSALPETLLESELFGHARGAFTGAERERAGRIAQAAGGTLFLDEVGELSPAVQAKLLRFLQFKEIQRVGSDETFRVDARVIAATHRDLASLVATGGFRQDLYFRLKVVELRVPPLRERRGDIAILADGFLRKKWRRAGETPHLTAAAAQALASHHFPGNVRELEHLMERVALLASGPEVDAPQILPFETDSSGPRPARFARFTAGELDAAREEAIAAIEKEFVTGLLARHDGNVSAAARDSGVNRTYLQKLLARYR